MGLPFKTCPQNLSQNWHIVTAKTAAFTQTVHVKSCNTNLVTIPKFLKSHKQPTNGKQDSLSIFNICFNINSNTFFETNTIHFFLSYFQMQISKNTVRQAFGIFQSTPGALKK